MQNKIDKQVLLIYKLNEKLNETLKEKEILKEKKRIIEISKFIEKNEKIANVINEVEDLSQNEKILQKCMAHCGRKFADILKAMPQENRKGALPYQFLELFGKIFEYEAKHKKLN